MSNPVSTVHHKTTAVPMIRESIWEGAIQLTLSSLTNVVAIFKRFVSMENCLVVTNLACPDNLFTFPLHFHHLKTPFNFSLVRILYVAFLNLFAATVLCYVPSVF